MDAPTARALAESRRGPWFRRLTEGALVLCVVALPALLAGLGLGAPAEAGELERLTAAQLGSDPTLVASFYQLTSDPGAIESSLPGHRASAALAAARRAQILLLLAASGLLYLAILFARGRSRALVGCVLFACLPAVSVRGHVLRPETPAVVFALLAVVMLQVFVRFLAQARTSPANTRVWERRLALIGAGLATAVTSALSMLCLAPQGILLLLPGVLLALVTVMLIWRFGLVLRRFKSRVLPSRAFTNRLAPWLALSFGVLLVATVSHSLVIGESANAVIPAATQTSDRLFFSADATATGFGSPFVGGVLCGLTVLGAGFGLFRVGLTLGRRRRIEPDLVLFVFALVFLAQRGLWSASVLDALPASPAAALLGAEGLVGLISVLLVARKRRSAA